MIARRGLAEQSVKQPEPKSVKQDDFNFIFFKLDIIET